MGRKERLIRRNNKVRSLFSELSNKYPKWRTDAVVDEVADRLFIAPRTVLAILKGEGTYADA